MAPEARVALLETGPARASLLSDVPLGIAVLVPYRSARNYGYQTAPQPGFGGRRGCQPRGRGLGGRSLINAMIDVRGQPDDYAAGGPRAARAGVGRTAPDFKRSEDDARGADMARRGGPLHVSERQLTATPRPRLLFRRRSRRASRARRFQRCAAGGRRGLINCSSAMGRRYNAARAYLEAGPSRPKLAVFSDCRARQIVFDGRRAVGVVCEAAGRLRDASRASARSSSARGRSARRNC